MSFFDSVLANTVGVAWRAASGTVDPWTKQVIIDQTNADIAKASGPLATPQEIAMNQAATEQIITETLRTNPGGSADPADASLRVPGLGSLNDPQFLKNLDWIVNIALVVGVLLFGFWVYQNFGRSIGKSFSRK